MLGSENIRYIRSLRKIRKMQTKFGKNGIIELLGVRDNKVLFRVWGDDICWMWASGTSSSFEGDHFVEEPEANITLYFEVSLNSTLRDPQNFLISVRRRLSRRIRRVQDIEDEFYRNDPLVLSSDFGL